VNINHTSKGSLIHLATLHSQGPIYFTSKFIVSKLAFERKNTRKNPDKKQTTLVFDPEKILKSTRYQRQNFASVVKVYHPKTIQSKITSSKINISIVEHKLVTFEFEVGPSKIHTKTFEVVNIDESITSVVSSSKIENYEMKTSFIDSHISTPHTKSKLFEIEPTVVKLYDLKGKIQSSDEIIFGDKPFNTKEGVYNLDVKEESLVSDLVYPRPKFGLPEPRVSILEFAEDYSSYFDSSTVISPIYSDQ